MGVFLCGQSFLSMYAGAMPFFSVCGGGGNLFSAWGGGGGIIGLAPPITIFAGASCHKNLSRSWRL